MKRPTGMRLARMRQYRRNMKRTHPEAFERIAAAQEARTRRHRRNWLLFLWIAPPTTLLAGAVAGLAIARTLLR